MARALHGSDRVVGAHDRIAVLDQVDKVIDIDQTRAHSALESGDLHQGTPAGASSPGTPEQVAAVRESYTGRFLAPLLPRRASRRASR